MFSVASLAGVRRYGDAMTEFEWHEGQVLAGLPVRQVHGWLADETGRFLLQDRVHERKFLLPGGQGDTGDDSWAATLLRECEEESQVRVVQNSVAYLGHQVVTGDPRSAGPYLQVRLFGVIKSFGPAAPDPDSGYMYRRLMTSAARAALLLDWGLPGEQQARAAALAGHRLGLPADHAQADSYV
jgi:8-oxo-dGTP pyrophosphatase MutT (NUDIX family)